MDSEYSLIFVPSKKDITEYAGADSYWCGLAEVHHEINFLLSEIAKVFFAAPLNEKKDIPYLCRPKVEQRCNKFPDLLVQLSILITSGTISAAFYKLVDSWVATRNGRKLRVRLPNGFEVEATQLGEKEFERLFALLYEKYSKEEVPDTKELARLGFKVFSSDEIANQTLVLRQAYDEKLKHLSPIAKPSYMDTPGNQG